MPKSFTGAQQRAITARGSSLLVSASAGSGKTTVMIERVISLMCEGHDIRRMLIVTFTRAAASDMRARLLSEINRRALSHAQLAAQRHYVEDAGISTLHSFCADFLREHFECVNIDPGFNILTDIARSALMSDALSAALKRAYAQPEIAPLVACRTPETVAEMAEIAHDFLAARPDPEAWLTGDFAAACAYEMERQNRRIADGTRASLTHLRDMCDGRELFAKYRAQLTEDIEDLQFSKMPPFIKKDADGADAALAGDIISQRGKIRDAYRGHERRISSCAPAASIAPAVDALMRLCKYYDEELYARKMRKNALDFDDLEHMTLNALNDDRIRTSARERYDFVFVDEYQDISESQEAIISALSRGDNLFMVGDVKQSIYRFRQAAPELFLSKRDAFTGGHRIDLNSNFRSDTSVIDFVNRVFTRIMTRASSGLDYAAEDALIPRGDADSGAPVEVHLYRGMLNDDEPTDGIAREIHALEKAQAEGVIIAELIERQRDAGYKYGEMAVLLSVSKGYAPMLLETLLARGIPAMADTGNSVFGTLEVLEMMDLLALIDNRRRDIPLIGVLRSQIVGLSCEQLAEIRLFAPDMPFCDAMHERMREDDALGNVLRDFWAQLTTWQQASRHEDLSRFIWRLYEETGYYAYVGAWPGGYARQANLRALAQRAADFASGGTLNDFLNSAVRAAAGDRSAARLVTSENAVRIMTIHKAKGLEFPVVFVAQMTRGIKRDQAKPLVAHPALGFGCEYTDENLRARRNSLPRAAIMLRNSDEDLRERMRLLYVALTRAQNKLILVGNGAHFDRAYKPLPHAAACFLDWISPILSGQDIVEMHDLPQAAQINKRAADANIVKMLTELSALPDADVPLYAAYPFAADILAPLKVTVTRLTREVEGPAEPPALKPAPDFTLVPENPGTQYGTSVHKVMAELNLSLNLADEAVLRAEIARIGGGKDNLPVSRIAAFFGTGIGRGMLSSFEVHREWAFNLRMSAKQALSTLGGRLLVQGMIDCCYTMDNAWILIDYKTDRAPDIDKYARQLALYGEALKRITGKPIKEMGIYSFAAGEWISLSQA